MICPSCKTDILLAARFCPSCATPLLTEQDIKTPDEVSLEWLKGILEGQGYQVEITLDNPNMMIARHQNKANLIVSIRQAISLITFLSCWTLKKPNWMQKAEFLTAVNKASTLHWLCTCYTSDELDELNVTTALYMCERISSRDIIVFVDMFADGISTVIEKSGIKKFS